MCEYVRVREYVCACVRECVRRARVFVLPQTKEVRRRKTAGEPDLLNRIQAIGLDVFVLINPACPSPAGVGVLNDRLRCPPCVAAVVPSRY